MFKFLKCIFVFGEGILLGILLKSSNRKTLEDVLWKRQLFVLLPFLFSFISYAESPHMPVFTVQYNPSL